MEKANQVKIWQRILVLIEALLLTLLIPVTRVGFKYLAPAGTFTSAIRQMGAGVIIVALMICLILWLRRKDFNTCGITLSGWRDGLKIGVILSVLCAGYVVACLPILRHAGMAGHFTPWEAHSRMIALLLALPGLVLFLWVLRFSEPIAKRMPTALAFILLVLLWITPLALAWHFDRPLGPTLITFIGSVLVSGPGEELIFRGYIQSRLNEAFGRPFSAADIQFGWGLFITSFLFGLAHIFNGVDFIHGPIQPQWTWGISAFLSGTIVFGYLREKTGSILAGAVYHGNNDAWALIVTNLAQ